MKNNYRKYTLITLLLNVFCQVSMAQFQIISLKNHEKVMPSSSRMAALNIPFFDDFSASTNRQDFSKWEKGGGVFVNNTFVTNHPTLNVATFDGLKSDGIPYDFLNALAEGATDTLTSLAIDLSKETFENFSRDSLYLSFFYTNQSLGERPDANDSLRVLFNIEGNIWVRVWGTNGKTNLNSFERVYIPVNKNNYRHSNFKFQFQTFGRKSGQFDVWHIDYVLLDKTRNYLRGTTQFITKNEDPERTITLTSVGNDKNKVTNIFTKDFAFKNPISPFLRRYNAMPLRQLLANQKLELADNIETDLYNLTSGQNFVITSYLVKDLFSNDTLQKETLPVVGPNALSSAQIKVVNNLSGKLKGNKALLKLKFKLDVGDIPLFSVNDTISRTVELNNYYAYDDGTAEQAAYLKKGFGRTAVQYILNSPDAITAIRINLQPTVTDLRGKRITFQILASDKGKPGRILKTFSDTTTIIKYPNTPNAFIEYKIDSVAVVDTFYVGYVQFTDDEPLAVGLDANSSQFTNRHFYNISNEWVNVTDGQKTSTFIPIKGSLMIRPVMAGKTIIEKPLATEEEIENDNLIIFPNPSTGIFKWNNPSLKNIEVFDMSGKVIIQQKSDNQSINLQELNAGTYFLRLSNERNSFVRKIVKE